MALNCGLYLSQAYLFKDRLDSCYYYLDRVSPLVDSTGFQDAMMHNISAIYAVKAYTGYAAAPCFFRFSDCHRDSECRQGNDYPQ